MQFSPGLRNAIVDAIGTYAGAAPTISIRTGSVPDEYDDPDTGDLLGQAVLDATWILPASDGSAYLSGTPVTMTAVATGTMGHFRIKRASDSEVVVQGSIGADEEDALTDDPDVNVGETIRIDIWRFRAGNR